MAYMEGHKAEVTGVRWADTTVVVPGGICMSSSMDGTIKVWRPALMRKDYNPCVCTLKGHVGFVNCITDVTGDRILSGGDDGSVRVWSLLDGSEMWCFPGAIPGADSEEPGEGHAGVVNCVRSIADIGFSGGSDNVILSWDLAAGVALMIYEGHTSPVTCIDITGNLFVSGSVDNTINVYDMDIPEQPEATFKVLKGSGSKAAVTAVRIVGNYLLTASGVDYENFPSSENFVVKEWSFGTIDGMLDNSIKDDKKK